MGEWILVLLGIVFLYFCLYGIVHMVRLRRRGTLRTHPFEDRELGISFRYPAAWELRPKDGRLAFVTNEHDGHGEIFISRREESQPGPEAAVRHSLSKAGIETDEPELHPFACGDWKGAYAESRATRETERIYFQEWVVDGEKLRVHLRYRCSVLYGQIDAFDIDQLFQSLAMEKLPQG